MFDADGAYSDEIRIKLQEYSDYTLMTIIPSVQWITDQSRVYPITLDPTVVVPYSDDDVKIAATSRREQKAYHLNQSSGILPRAIGHMTDDDFDLYLKYSLPPLDFDSIDIYQPNIMDRAATGCTILNASLLLGTDIYYYKRADKYYDWYPTFEVHALTSSWQDNFTYAQRPSAGDLIAYSAVKDIPYDWQPPVDGPNEPGFFHDVPFIFEANITSEVRKWYEDPSTNKGLFLTYSERSECETYSLNLYKVSNSPKLTVSYINNAGMENYWTYTTASMDETATVNVNNYSGYVCATFADYVSPNTRNGASIYHVYNDNFVVGGLTEYGQHSVGKGFMLNIMETLTQRTLETSSEDPRRDYYFLHTDSDGTFHYFNWDIASEKYLYDTDNNVWLEKINADKFIIHYRSGLTKTFVHQKLTEICDPNGNKIEIIFEEQQSFYETAPIKVREILADQVCREIELIWNEQDRLSQIITSEGDVISYLYSGEHLSDIFRSVNSAYTAEQETATGYQQDMIFTYSATTDYPLLHTIGSSLSDQDITIGRAGGGGKVNILKKTTTLENSSTGTPTNHLDLYCRFKYNSNTSTTVTNLIDGNYEETYLFNYAGIARSVSDNHGNHRFFEYGAEGADQYRKTFDSRLFTSFPEVVADSSIELGLSSNDAVWSGSNAFVNTSLTAVHSGEKSAMISKGGSISQTVIPEKTGEHVFSAYINGQGSARGQMEIYRNNTLIASSDESSGGNGYELVSGSTSLTKGASYVVKIKWTGGGDAESIYVDDVSIAQGTAPGGVNNVLNSSFNMGKLGTLYDNAAFWDDDGFIDMTYESGSAKFNDTGSMSGELFQTVYINGSAGDELIFSADIEASGLELDLKPYLRVEAIGANGVIVGSSQVALEGNTYGDWHTFSGSLNPGSSYESVLIRIGYFSNAGYLRVSHVSLRQGAAGTRYTRNQFGDIVGITGTSTSSKTYNTRGQVTRETDGEGDSLYYEYDDRGNLIKTSNSVGTVTQNTVDSYGNVVSSFTGSASDVSDHLNSALLDLGSTAYGNYGTTVASKKDAMGNTTTYNVNSTTLKTNSVTSPSGTTTSYSYYKNASGDTQNLGPLRELKATKNQATLASVSYNYNKGVLSRINRNSFSYEFSERQLQSTGTFSSIRIVPKIGTPRILSTNYYDGAGRLTQSKLGNTGQLGTVSYQYDRLGRMLKKTMGTSVYSYRYNQEGDLYEEQGVKGAAALYSRKTEYDTKGRVASSRYNRESVLNVLTQYEYLNNDLVEKMHQTIPDKVIDYEYIYNRDGTLAVQTVMDSRYDVVAGMTYWYDDCGRDETEALATLGGMAYKGYSYHTNGSATGPQQTALLKRIGIQLDPNKPNLDLNTNNLPDYGFEYTYNADGNISKITARGSSQINGVSSSYSYDGLGQLTYANSSVGNAVVSESFSYDTEGNLQSRSCDGASYQYTYGDSSWSDLLTKVTKNGVTIRNFQYNGIGNPTSDGTNSYQWNGRQLSAINNGGKAGYEYDASGTRIRKTAGGTTYDYFYNNGLLTLEKRSGSSGSSMLYYIYGNDGLEVIYQITGGVYQGYYVMKDAQGNVFGLAKITPGSNALQVVCLYYYSAYGELLKVTDANGGAITDQSHIAYQNPFRYRGYYYDNETGFYCLQSRYYDPEIGRFLNADMITDGQAGILGYNLFLYAANNPINNSDPSGNWIIKDAVKWLAKNVVKPVVQAARRLMSKVSATYTKGITGTATTGIFDITGQIGLSVDTDGNVGIQGSWGGGVSTGTPGASIATFSTITNASVISDLLGEGYQLGCSVGTAVEGVPLSAGGDLNFIPIPNSNTCYFGLTQSVGFGTPGGEIHGEITKTYNIISFNIYENIFKPIYIKIMEW